MIDIIFLGTGGGRYTTITQKRRTGGIRVLSKQLNMHIDPGPGAHIYSLNAGLDPQKINTIVVSHSHIDHVNDASLLIEAMGLGARQKRGLLAATHSVLRGNKVCNQSISDYHQSLPRKVVDFCKSKDFSTSCLRGRAVEARHSDPDTVGFNFEIGGQCQIGYVADSEYFQGIGKPYQGVKLLIISVLRPSGKPWNGHMTTDDAIKVIKEADPEMALITHFGMLMITKGPNREAEQISIETGIPTRAAYDNMHITVGDEIKIYRGNKRH